MKRYFIIILLAGLMATNNEGNAQNTFLKTDLLGPLIENPFLVGIEMNNRKPGSFIINFEGGYYMRDKGIDFGQVTWKKKITGFGIIPEYRRYLRYRSHLNKPVGVFAGAYGRIFNLKYTQDFEDTSAEDISERHWAGGIGLEIGYKYKKPYKHFFAEVLFGAGLGVIDFDNFDNDYLPDQYFLSRVELSIGYAFQ
jgi:hypothetical protein